MTSTIYVLFCRELPSDTDSIADLRYKFVIFHYLLDKYNKCRCLHDSD